MDLIKDIGSQILAYLMGAVIFAGISVLVKIVAKQNKALISWVMVALISIGAMLYILGEEIHQYGIGIIGFITALLSGFVLVIVGLVWLLSPFEKRSKKTPTIIIHNKKKLLIKMPELEFKNNEIIYYEENWTIDQFSNANKLRDLFVDYCEIGGVIRIVKILSLNTYFALMPVKTEDSVVIMSRYFNKTLKEKLQNRELTLEELLGNVWDWTALEDHEAMYKSSEIRSIVQHTKESLNKADCQTHQTNHKTKKNKKNMRNKINKINKKNKR